MLTLTDCLRISHGLAHNHFKLDQTSVLVPDNPEAVSHFYWEMVLVIRPLAADMIAPAQAPPSTRRLRGAS